MTCRQILSFPAGKGTVVDIKDHGDCRRIYKYPGKRHGIVLRCNRIADTDGLDAGNSDDITGLDDIHLFFLQTVKRIKGGKPDTWCDRIFSAKGICMIHREHSVDQPPYANLPHIGIVIEIRNQELGNLCIIGSRTWYGGTDGVKQGLEIFRLISLLQMGNAPFCVGIEDGKLDLPLVRIEIDKKVVNLINDLLDPGVTAVDLIDDDHNGQLFCEGFFNDKSCLRKRSLTGIDQQNGPIDHIQAAFNLTAEIRMPGRINDIDLDVVVPYGRILRHDGNPPLPFEIHRVHHPLCDLLILPEGASLLEHGINEGRFTMINVGNDNNISYVLLSQMCCLSFKRHPPLSIDG